MNVTFMITMHQVSAFRPRLPCSQRRPSRIWSERLMALASVSVVVGFRRNLATRTAAIAKTAACSAKGADGVAANRNAPSGGPSSWFPTVNVADSRALARPRWSVSTRADDESAAGGIGEGFSGAEQEQCQVEQWQRQEPACHGREDQQQDQRPRGVHRHH
jgi:hypothetical protein